MTSEELARAYNVTSRTIRNWIANGLPYTQAKKNAPLTFDEPKAREWIERYADLTGRPCNRAKRGGQERKADPTPAAPQPEIDFNDENPPQVPTTVEEVDDLSRRGELTVGSLSLAESAAKLRKILREEAVATAALLPVEDVIEAWGAGLARLSVTLDRLAARISGRLVELGVPPAHRHAAMAMIDEEVARCRTETIAAYGERVNDSDAGATDPRRTSEEGTGPPPPAVGQ